MGEHVGQIVVVFGGHGVLAGEARAAKAYRRRRAVVNHVTVSQQQVTAQSRLVRRVELERSARCVASAKHLKNSRIVGVLLLKLAQNRGAAVQLSETEVVVVAMTNAGFYAPHPIRR
jgi:hypothetical protein